MLFSNCLTPSPEPFVSYKGAEEKGHHKSYISQEADIRTRKTKNPFGRIDLREVKLSRAGVFFLQTQSNEFHGEFTILKYKPQIN